MGKSYTTEVTREVKWAIHPPTMGDGDGDGDGDGHRLTIYSVIPVRGVLYPNQVVKIAIGKRSIKHLVHHLGQDTAGLEDFEDGSEGATKLAVALARPGGEPPVHTVGTAVRILEVRALPQTGTEYAATLEQGTVFVVAMQGIERVAFDGEPVVEENSLPATSLEAV